MKNANFILFSSIFLLLILLTSCKDDCESLVCLNGGACQNGTCICPEGFSGVNCENNELICGTGACVNGGVCNNEVCECPQGFTGTFCETPITPQKIFIERVRVLNFPENNGSYTWDDTGVYETTGTEADLKLVVMINNTIILEENEIFWDALPGNIYTFTTGFPIEVSSSYFNSVYDFYIYDKDNAPVIEFIETINFTPSAETLGLPQKITKSSNGLVVELELSYQL